MRSECFFLTKAERETLTLALWVAETESQVEYEEVERLVLKLAKPEKGWLPVHKVELRQQLHNVQRGETTVTEALALLR